MADSHSFIDMTTVAAILPQGGDVKRLEFADGSVLDVACVDVAVGDAVSVGCIELAAPIPADAVYVGRGTVFSVADGTMHVSCGGLLGRLPATAALHDDVRVAVVKA